MKPITEAIKLSDKLFELDQEYNSTHNKKKERKLEYKMEDLSEELESLIAKYPEVQEYSDKNRSKLSNLLPYLDMEYLVDRINDSEIQRLNYLIDSVDNNWVHVYTLDDIDFVENIIDWFGKLSDKEYMG